MNISEEISKKRQDLGITVKEFSDALGLDVNGYSLIKEWESGVSEPDEETAKKIKQFAEKIPFKTNNSPLFRVIDLFAGIGGIRIPFQELGGECVFSSEWDKFSQKTYKANFGETPAGDLTKIDAVSTPDFDILLGGFP